MPEQNGRIVVSGLTKTFGGTRQRRTRPGTNRPGTNRPGTVRAVDDLSFSVEPGSITGFLGPNGAGKTTTLRMLLGLVTPDSGTATIGGRPYRDLPKPNEVVGAALEASGFHPSRTGRAHLRVYCRVNAFPAKRSEEVLGMVGLTDAADRAVRGYSLGMRQRLALATALLGDPRVLVLDEPANGLDPEGIVWMRGLLRGLAREGRTVLVSSHVLTEVQQLVDHVVILNHGRMVRQGPLRELFAMQATVSVRTPQADRFATALARAGHRQIDRSAPDTLQVTGMDASQVGRLAFTEQIELHELATRHNDLEQVFFSLTAGPAGPDSPGPQSVVTGEAIPAVEGAR